MIELEKVLSEWKEDSQITRENLTEDSRITPASVSYTHLTLPTKA